MDYNLNEGSEYGDLKRVVKPAIEIDSYCSKMGDDKDITVVSFTIFGIEPANDLVNFFEKSYDWVLDADVSSGETSDGNYMVFVEMQRKPKVAEKIYTMLNDMMNLTEQKVKDWTFTYHKDTEALPVTLKNLTAKIIDSPEKYEIKTDETLGESAELNKLRASAGITVKPTKIVDLQILDIMIAAGLR